MEKKIHPEQNQVKGYQVTVHFAGETADGTEEADTVSRRCRQYVRWLHQIPQDIRYERTV